MAETQRRIPGTDIQYSLTDWNRSDTYHNSFLIPPGNEQTDLLEKASKNSLDNGLPNIAVSKAQGKFLNLLVKTLGVKRILEVGTLAGYSTIWLGLALPEDGDLVTLEINEKHAKIAEENLSLAGLSSKCKVVLGPAHDSMIKLKPQVPFDFVFIDADKESNCQYFTEAKRLLKPGGVIVVDNVIRYGRVSDPNYSDPSVEGIRDLLKMLKEDKEIEATTIGTVGEKGYDGFIYAVRK
ncbi:hypothetical protein VKT23_015179 [Stygiomarasmius scandens]|uniref:O-methyltransferase n=1 Tax=Marasmiellus scandens TaxID=2682957 RepID=A0ABR1IYG9_9AGAR